MEYTVIIHPSEEKGFWAEVPALPRCFSQGETFEQTLTNIREAIELQINELKEVGEMIPSDENVIVCRVSVEPEIARNNKTNQKDNGKS